MTFLPLARSSLSLMPVAVNMAAPFQKSEL